MQRIYKAARKCGYLQGLIEPLEPKDAKKVSKIRLYTLLLVARENQWGQ